jgi:hypothetical protein
VRACFCFYVGLTLGAWLLARLSFIIEAWLLAHPNTFSFHLSFTHLLTTLRIHLSISHPVVHFSWCQCDQTIDDLDIHLLHCLCRNEHTANHNTFRDIVTTIVSKNGVHVQREVFHLFLHHTQRWVNIVITRDDFWIVVDVVIADLIRIDLV